MAEKIVGLISCLLCAVPFLIIGIFEKNSKEPITFWSGDKTLKSKAKDVRLTIWKWGCCIKSARSHLCFPESAA